MYRVDLTDGKSEKVPDLPPDIHRAATGALAPDDRTLYAPASDAHTPPQSWDQIIAIDLRTGTIRPVWKLPGDQATLPGWGGVSLALSPDGRTLAVSLYDPAAKTARLFRVDVDGGGYGRNDHELWGPYSLRNGDNYEKVAWANNDQILFVVTAQRANGSPEKWSIMRIAVTGGPAEPILTVNGSDTASRSIPVRTEPTSPFIRTAPPRSRSVRSPALTMCCGGWTSARR